jgi:hypothetical protein
MRFQKLTAVLLLFLGSTTVIACSVIRLIWIASSDSADSLYRFVINEKAGYIDRLGKVVIPPTLSVYDSGSEFHNGLLEISLSDGKYIDKSGRALNFPKFYRGWQFSEGLAAVLPTADSKWGYIDTTGHFAIAQQFDNYPAGYVSSFSDGYAMIETKQRIGYIDKTGEFVIAPRFLRGTNFREGRAWVVIDGPCFYASFTGCPDFGVLPSSVKQEAKAKLPRCRSALIDKSGRVLSGNSFDEVADFSEGLGAIAVNDLWGYANRNGDIQIPPRFETVGRFNSGLALVGFRAESGNLEFGYIDRNGVIVIPARFGSAEDFSDGLAVVAESVQGPYHYIDTSGRQPIPRSFLLASPFFKGLAHVRLSKSEEYGPYGKYAYIDSRGEAIFTYDRLKPPAGR